MNTLRVRDVSLFVKTMGHGDPLLLMHGGPGLDHTSLAALEPLAEEFRLIFYDHRANGRSTGAPETMTFENLVADAEGLRQILGLDRWAVLGHSFGGHIGFEYALRHPERVSRLLLLDTAADARVWQRTAPALLAKRGFKPAAVEAARRFFNGEFTPREMRPLVMKFMRGYFYKLRLRDFRHVAAAAFRMRMRPDASVFGFGTLLRNWSVMDRLGEIEMPTLLLSGRFDFLSPTEHVAIVADRMPNAQLEIIERAGHLPFDENPDATLAILRRFLSAPAEISALVQAEARHELASAS